MTFAVFIVLILGFLIAILNFLPDAGNLPIGISNAIYGKVGTLKAWNWLLPVNELLTAVKVVISYEVIVWAWHTLVKIAKYLRGHSDGA